MLARVVQNQGPVIDVAAHGSEGQLGGGRVEQSLLTVLFRRRWTVVLATVAALIAAIVYLLYATPIYTSTARIYVEQRGMKILSDVPSGMPRSDSFLYTQAEVLKSQPILQKSIENERVNWRRLATFAEIDNPIAALQLGKSYSVSVGKKDDVISVSMQSPYPQEAADIVNEVIATYVEYCLEQTKSTAAEMLKVLQKEKVARETELDERVSALTQYKQDNGALSFSSSDKGNIILERLATLSASYTDAELAAIDARMERDQVRAIIDDAAKVKAFVQAKQTEARNDGDRDYQGLLQEIRKFELSYMGNDPVLGKNNKQSVGTETALRALYAMLERKEMEMARAYLVQAENQCAALDARVAEVKAAFELQQKEALVLNTKAAEYARLESNVERTQKQCDLLDARIKEINVNSADAGALNVQTLEAAKPGDKPTSPKRSLTLAVAMMLGLMLGCGLALAQDMVDQRLRTPDEIADALGLPVLGVVPHIPGREPMEVRGRYMHIHGTSEIAESFRTVRTALFFGSKAAKKILVTSPAPGDGKSTAASNLAIAMAQAGHRTVLVDCDLRKPVQHNIHQLDAGLGLLPALEGKAKLKDSVLRTEIVNLHVLPCGPLPANPSEILTSKRFAQVLAALEAAFDRIIIDSPPVTAVSDAQVLTSAADATIMVVRLDKSTRRAAIFAADALSSTGGSVVGTIVNDMPKSRAKYGYYYAGYRGYYGSDRRPSRHLEVAAVGSRLPAANVEGDVHEDHAPGKDNA